MGRIVLHVGPEKCGSSSIQSALLNPSGVLDDVACARMLSPKILEQLDTPQPAPEAVAGIHALIREARAAHPGKVLVLSHEMIFKMVDVMVNLCAIAKEHAEEVTVIAYLRRQSDFLVSSFGQWIFRAPDRIAEAAEALRRHGLDPSLFWGVERHLIACILEGWHIGRQLSNHLYLDWSDSIPERAAALAPLNVRLSTGVLPRAGFRFPLVEDFLTRAGLDPAVAPKGDRVANSAYDPFLIEAVVNAIETGYPMPGPHEANAFFDRASRLRNLNLVPDLELMDLLKSCVDTAFEAGNTRLAARLGLPSGYFTPERRIDLPRIRSEIEREATIRSSEPASLRLHNRTSRAALALMAVSEFRRAS